MTMMNDYKWYDRDLIHQFTYMIPIESPDNQDIVWSRMFFFGTGRANCLGVGGMNCVRRDQVEWFREVSDDIDKDE